MINILSESMALLSVIVPCYNEEESLNPFYDELNRVASDMADYDFEFLFIDDGSKDATLSILKQFAQTDERVKYIGCGDDFNIVFNLVRRVAMLGNSWSTRHNFGVIA